MSPLSSPRRYFPALAVAALANAALLAGCANDHKVTQPPPPPPPYLEQSSPANVLANLRTAYQERNYEQYDKLLSRDFVFVFAPSDVADPVHPTPDQWFRQEEMESARCLFTSDSLQLIQIAWSPGEAEPSGEVIPNSWKIRADALRLDVHTRRTDNEFWIYMVRGSFEDFYFREDLSYTYPNGKHRWYCIRWDDSPTGGKAAVASRPIGSWGQLKEGWCREIVGP